MSAFANGSGTNSDINAQSGLTGALAGGSGDALTIGNGTPDSPRFTLPANVANVVAGGTGTDPTAGLTGVQSGMTMPNFAAAMGGDGNYSFNMPSSSGGPNLGGLAAAGGKLTSALQNQPKLQGGTGRVTTRAENFGAPVIALPMASGSTAGNSLLQMMQRYQPGNVVGTNVGSGYGMR